MYFKMYKLFKRFKEKRRRKQILKDIIKAKKCYINRERSHMCTCFQEVNKKYLISGVANIIPEFNRAFLSATYTSSPLWWPTKDRKSRLKAFDKLIEVYSK